MQRCFFEENVFQQFTCYIGVDDRTGFHDFAQFGFAFNDNQSTRFGLGHIGAGFDQLRNGPQCLIIWLDAFRRKKRWQPASPDRVQHTPELRLKQNNERNGADLKRCSQNVVDDIQLKPSANLINNQNDANAFQNLTGAGIFQKLHQLIENKCDQQNIKNVLPAQPCNRVFEKRQNLSHTLPALLKKSAEFLSEKRI